MRTITIELPETMTIKGATDAPESVRVLPTDKWDAGFMLTAALHGVSQKIGDTWSVSKKDVTKTQATADALKAGEWSARRTERLSPEDKALQAALGARLSRPKGASLDEWLEQWVRALAEDQGKDFDESMVKTAHDFLKKSEVYKTTLAAEKAKTKTAKTAEDGPVFK